MKIKFKKTGNYSLHPVYGPIITCALGNEAELAEDDAQKLIADGWAESFLHDDFPWEQDGWDENADDAREILCKYALKKFKIKLNRRYKVSTLIYQIKAAAL